MIKKRLFTGLFVAVSLLGFAGTLYFLDDGKPQLTAALTLPHVVSQEFEDETAADLMKRGKILYSDKDYANSFRVVQAAFGKAKPRTIPRKKAALYLGLHYYYGQGTSKNLGNAYQLFRLPDLGNNRQAQYLSGLILMTKSFSGYDLATARQRLQKAESMGIKRASFYLKQIEKM